VIGSVIEVRGDDIYVVSGSKERGRIDIGTFVRIGSTVGVVIDYLNSVRDELLPYMSTPYRERYVPYEREYDTLQYIVLGIGCPSQHGIEPPLMIRVGEEVVQLTDEEVIQLHRRFGAFYVGENIHRIGREAIMKILSKLENLLPERKEEIKAMRKLIKSHFSSGKSSSI
jgi:hypothetical protein